MSDQPEDTLLSDLCTICHLTPPKYRCPRCQTRTCSLTCTRRHKIWSQCSGIRDPGAYLRRNELAIESAFDRDYNFITGVERTVERAERDAENRGIRIERGNSEDVGNRKRKRGTGAGIPDAAGGGLEKGEAALLRRAADAGVTVIKAPKGMSRRKGNSSRWFSKQKCLNWSVEWILPNHKKVARNCVESSTLADAYDRVSPPPRDESTGHVRVQVHEQVPGHGQESTQVEFENIQEDSMSPSQQLDSSKQLGSNQSASEEITPHRDVYFYLHRPRTATKQPVLIPLVPNMTFTTALRGRTVLEFPTIYVLPDSPRGLLTEKSHLFLLEEEYLRTVEPGEEPGEEAGKVPAANARGAGDSSIDVVDLGQVDEQKVLDVLKQDISGTGRA